MDMSFFLGVLLAVAVVVILLEDRSGSSPSESSLWSSGWVNMRKP